MRVLSPYVRAGPRKGNNTPSQAVTSRADGKQVCAVDLKSVGLNPVDDPLWRRKNIFTWEAGLAVGRILYGKALLPAVNLDGLLKGVSLLHLFVISGSCPFQNQLETEQRGGRCFLCPERSRPCL